MRKVINDDKKFKAEYERYLNGIYPSLDLVAMRFDCDRTTIAKNAERLGLPKKPHPNCKVIDLDRFVTGYNRWARGEIPLWDLQYEWGVSYPTLHKWLLEFGRNEGVIAKCDFIRISDREWDDARKYQEQHSEL